MSEKTPIVTHESQPDTARENNAEVYEVPDRDALLGEFAEKRQQFTDELNQLEAKPGFKRVYEDNAEIAGVKDDIEAVNAEWAHYGGDAIDAAQAKIDALNFKSSAEDHIYAKAELRDAKNAFYENFKKEFEASNVPDEESLETSLKPNTEATPKGERLTDYLSEIRKAQENNDELLEKVLLKAYKEILDSKSSDPKWVERHMEIAKTSQKNISAEKDTPATPDKYRAQFREAVNEVLNREDEPKEQAAEKTEAEKLADQAREVAEEAKRNVDAADNAAPVAPSQEQKAEVKQDIEPEAEVEAKKLNRTRKLGKWVTGLFSRTLGSEGKSRRSAKREGKAELRNEREAKIAARGDEIYAERVAQHGQPGAYYENFEPTMERAQKDAKKEFSRFQKVREKTSDAKRVVGNAKNAFTETMAKERAERDNKSKESAVNEPEQPRSTPETKPMPTSEKPAPVTNLNGENLSPADLNTTQTLPRPEVSEGEQKAA